MTRFPTAGILLALATCLAHAPAAAQQRAAEVLVEPVEVREIADTAPVIAQLVGTVSASIASRTSGVVSEVLFQLGDRVAVGAPLVRLDAELFEIQHRTADAALVAARAGIEIAEARVKLAEQAFARQSQLQGSTAFSRGQFEDLEQEAVRARSELAQAHAMASSAEAALARADYDLTHAVIEAPFDGVVIERTAQPGQYIGLGEPVATLLDIGRLEIEADMPVDLVAGLAPGRKVGARFDDGTVLEVEVRSILPVEAVSTRTRPVRFTGDFSGIDRSGLAAGKSVTLQVPVSAPRSVPTVPKDALVQGRAGWEVFVAADGTAEPRPVTLGQANGDRFEVVSGLSPGELVVVRGNERLRPGQPIAPRRAGADTASPTGG